MPKDDKQQNPTPEALKAQQDKAAGDAKGKAVEAAAPGVGKTIHDGIGNLVDGAKNLISGDKDDKSAKDKSDKKPDAKKPAEEKKEDKKPGFFDNMNVGGILGGILGAVGAWITGSAFGGGMVGMAVSALLMIPAALIGRKLGDEHINGWLSRPSDADKAAVAQGAEKSSPQAKTKEVSQAEAQQMYEQYLKLGGHVNVNYSAQNVNSAAIQSPAFVPPPNRHPLPPLKNR